jgi:hypothetical protein
MRQEGDAVCVLSANSDGSMSGRKKPGIGFCRVIASVLGSAKASNDLPRCNYVASQNSNPAMASTALVLDRTFLFARD